MGSQVSQTKRGRLFWLGRYVERCCSSISYLMDFYDASIDSNAPDYRDYCRRMGIPDDYADGEDFLQRHLFDASSPYSVRSYLDAAIGNGMLLREVLSTRTFAYLLMAQGELDAASRSDGPCYELQRVLDNIMAFHGSFDDTPDAEDARNITKTGGMAERISTMIRMSGDPVRLNKELQKILNRLYKTDVDTNPRAADIIAKRAIEGFLIPESDLLYAVENLFIL